jgi:hypothetical protein
MEEHRVESLDELEAEVVIPPTVTPMVSCRHSTARSAPSAAR